VTFAVASLAGGLAQNAGVLVGARLVQGLGAAIMMPAALSLLTTTFSSGSDRPKALGVWGGIAGLASALGVFLGGVLTEGPGWRWVLEVNPPIAALLLVGVFALIPADSPDDQVKGFDLAGAVLITGLRRRRTPIFRPSAASSTRSWPRPARATSPRSSECSTPTSSSESTRADAPE
jgi:MFS family permease